MQLQKNLKAMHKHDSLDFYNEMKGLKDSKKDTSSSKFGNNLKSYLKNPMIKRRRALKRHTPMNKINRDNRIKETYNIPSIIDAGSTSKRKDYTIIQRIVIMKTFDFFGYWLS